MHHRMTPSKTVWLSLNVVIFPPFILVGLRTYQHPGTTSTHICRCKQEKGLLSTYTQQHTEMLVEKLAAHETAQL
jgi:hypothetical protein